MIRSLDRLVPARGAPPLNADGSLHDTPPSAFGPFRVLHQVGAGSLGPVFRAHDPDNDRLVAIKAFRLDLTPEGAQEFASALEDLVNDQPHHPAIAAALAAGVQGSTPYLAQEYVAGEALDAVLRQFGPPPPDEALTTLARVADALDRAAGDGIHHGTLHPRDVLVTERGEARVIDLGVAQALGRCGLRVPVRRPYSAPERAEHETWSGPADIYALGAIAYELLTGRRAAGPGTPAIPPGSLQVPSPQAVAEVLARALALDPAQRYPAAADLIDALVPLVTPTARRGAARRRVTPGSRREIPLPLDDRHDDVPAHDAGAAVPFEAEQEHPTFVSEKELPSLTLREPVSEAAPHEVSFRGVDPAVADEHQRFASLEDEDHHDALRPDAVLGAHQAEVAPAREPELRGAAWTSSAAAGVAALERRPMLPLVIALLVGVAAGFGWGYWTAWRSLGRQPAPAAAAVTSTGTPASTSAGGGAGRDRQPAADSGAAREPARPQRGATPPARPEPSPSRPQPPREASPAPRPVPAETRPASAPGRLTLRSTPAGARVLIDGRSRGRTPLVLRDLPLRVLRVTFEREGYVADERRVALSARQPSVTVNATLRPATPPAPIATLGVLVVESRPAGAQVFVDGRAVGVTPLSIPDVTPGTHRVRLELAGFNPWATTAEVVAGQRARVAASLEQGTPR